MLGWDPLIASTHTREDYSKQKKMYISDYCFQGDLKKNPSARRSVERMRAELLSVGLGCFSPCKSACFCSCSPSLLSSPDHRCLFPPISLSLSSLTLSQPPCHTSPASANGSPVILSPTQTQRERGGRDRERGGGERDKPTKCQRQHCNHKIYCLHPHKKTYAQTYVVFVRHTRTHTHTYMALNR